MNQLTPRECAKELGVCYRTVKNWIRDGKLKTFITPGGHHRIPNTEIDRIKKEKD